MAAPVYMWECEYMFQNAPGSRSGCPARSCLLTCCRPLVLLVPLKGSFHRRGVLRDRRYGLFYLLNAGVCHAIVLPWMRIHSQMQMDCRTVSL